VGAVEGGAATLATLAAAGIPIGLVSDTSLAGGRHLRGYLEDHGLLDHIDHCSFSDEVGVYKPDAKIFRDCLAGLGVDDPTGVVHVGDLRRTDVAGAWRLGMTTVRFRGVVDDADRSEGSEAHHVIDRLTDLPALLGVAGG
jgi:putative hydrolase of the HAD superfamily